MAIEIMNGSALYEVGKLVAETTEYRVYICVQRSTERRCLLQVATSVEYNGGLDRAAYAHRELLRKAGELEAEYSKTQGGKTHVLLNYELTFPELVDSFVCVEQGGRRINILAFRNVDDVSRMVPLGNINTKFRQRVDLRTSAWIMGKLLKLLVFAHSEGFAVGLMTGSNILIEPEKHYVLAFDWSRAQTFSPGEVPVGIRRRDIVEAARAVYAAMGGDLATGICPCDGDEAPEYVDFILRLANGSRNDAKKAHKEFYTLVDSLWPREYYPFTTKPLVG